MRIMIEFEFIEYFHFYISFFISLVDYSKLVTMADKLVEIMDLVQTSYPLVLSRFAIVNVYVTFKMYLCHTQNI